MRGRIGSCSSFLGSSTIVPLVGVDAGAVRVVDEAGVEVVVLVVDVVSSEASVEDNDDVSGGSVTVELETSDPSSLDGFVGDEVGAGDVSPWPSSVVKLGTDVSVTSCLRRRPTPVGVDKTQPTMTAA